MLAKAEMENSSEVWTTMLLSSMQQLDLYYRHARHENMLVAGSEHNKNKILWIREHTNMFQSLGWGFISVDLSGELGPHHLNGDTWSSIEHRALRNITNPVIRVENAQQMLTVIDQLIELLGQEALSQTILLNFGSNHLDPTLVGSAIKSIRRLLAHRQGVWLILPQLQALPIEFSTKLFHSHIILDRHGVTNDVLGKWAAHLRVDLSDWNVGDINSIFVFNGRSEGAKGQTFVFSSETKFHTPFAKRSH
jgi:hypothetical protein